MGIIPRVEPDDFFFPPPLLARAMITKPSMAAHTSDFLNMWFSFSVKILYISSAKILYFFRIPLTVFIKVYEILHLLINIYTLY